MLELTAEERSKLKPCRRSCTMFQRLVKMSERRGECYVAINQPNARRPQIRCFITSKQVAVQAWIHQNGPVPSGKFILHTCDIGRCWRPDHTYAGTNAQNQLDRAKRNRNSWIRGNKHPYTKHSEEVVAEAKNRIASGEDLGEVAKSLGFRKPYLRAIVRGRNRRRD